ncbi:MAG: hypothetical protein WCR01_10400 [Bacteroidota bacterium]
MKDKLVQYFKQNAIYLVLLAYGLAGVMTIVFFDGTGDSGDSIMHYLFARYAPVHPELYFDHWAKPLFVLISSPFAQFGFNGMKLFNLSVSLLTLYLTYLTARSLGMPNPLLGVVFLIFMPLQYILTFSGLTEPLFALFLIGAIFLAIHRKYLAAAVVVSLMPFVRSEGLIIIVVFGGWLLCKRQWKYIPWLLAGHILYSFAGYSVHHDLLWIFTKIPYGSLDAKYGSGPLLHFVTQMNYVIGVPLYLLLVAGIFSYLWHWIRKKGMISPDETILIFAGFFLFFIAHSLFWYLGIFNSMGLKRVLLGAAPLISLMALRGFNLLTLEIIPGKKVVTRIMGGLLVTYVVIFPFTHNPAAIRFSNDMKATREQTMAKAVASYMAQNPVPPQNKMLYTHPYLSESMNIDHFNGLRRRDLTMRNVSLLQPGDKVIWDNWFAVVETKTTLRSLLETPGLVREIDFSANEDGHEIKFVVLRKD